MDENLIDVQYAGGQIRKLLANGCISEIAHDCATRALNALTRVESRLLDQADVPPASPGPMGAEADNQESWCDTPDAIDDDRR